MHSTFLAVQHGGGRAVGIQMSRDTASSSCGLVGDEAGQHRAHVKPVTMGMGCCDSAGWNLLAFW